ncbi:MAG: hypothetical protein E6Q97_26350 [Desulfurellales bacterium]|nr:MAG: hypothetical protein E6Q97_26350 [Desulfurellales bacterium]
MPSTRSGGRPAPKVPTAIELWKRYAGQIESDLTRLGIDIADWHQATRDEHGRLKLSSRKLLVLLKYLPDESQTRTDAERGGRQTRGQRVLEETLNEAMRLRASTEAIGSRGEVRWDPDEYAWRDPVDQKRIDEQLAVERVEAARAQEDLLTDLGFT